MDFDLYFDLYFDFDLIWNYRTVDGIDTNGSDRNTDRMAGSLHL